jgi:hypothetical protein
VDVIVVIETWHLKPECVGQAREIMQEMDELVGPRAHQDAAWAGHADFYHSHAQSDTVLMAYPWRSVEEHRGLAASEDPDLQDFYRTYCAVPREISYYTPLPVDVDHDDHAPGHHEHSNS